MHTLLETFAASIRARDRLVAVVTIGDSSLPDEISHLHCIDASNLDLGSAAEAIDDTLLSGTPAVPATPRDRRASFLSLPSGLFGFLVAYLAMQTVVGYELVFFSAVEDWATDGTGLALLALTMGWIPLVMTRRSGLGLSIACTTAAVLLAAVSIVLRGDAEALPWLTIPIAWSAYQYRMNRRARTKAPDPEFGDTRPRDIDIGASNVNVGALEWIFALAIAGAGLAALLLV